MDRDRVSADVVTAEERESYPASSSGGVLVEREQAKRLSLPLLLLLLLLLLLFFWLYLFGPGGRFGESITTTVTERTVVETISSTPRSRDRADGTEQRIVPPGGVEVGDGHSLGTPGRRAADIVLAPDPTTPAPPPITLTAAERDFEPRIMMGVNLIQEAIDYISRGSEDGSEVLTRMVYKYRHVIDFNRDLAPVGRWVPIHNGLAPVVDRLEAAMDALEGGDTAAAKPLMAGVQASLDSARVPMDRLVDGSSTY